MSGNDHSTGASNSVTTSSDTSSKWLTEEICKLIEMIQKEEAMYNPRHKYYYCRPYAENVWREIDLKLEKPPASSSRKWQLLRKSFYREEKKFAEGKVSPWPYFDRMLFLQQHLKKNQEQVKLESRVQNTGVNVDSASLSANTGVDDIHVQTTQPPLDNLKSINEQHNTELVKIIEEKKQNHSVNNDNESESDESANDFDADVRDDTDEHEPQETKVDANNTDKHSLVLGSLASNLTEHTMQQKQQNFQHLNNVTSSVQLSSSNNANRVHHTQLCSSTPTQHSNASFVRPTFVNPADYACPSTASNTRHNVSGRNNSIISIHSQQKLDTKSNNDAMSITASTVPSLSSSDQEANLLLLAALYSLF